MYRKASEAQKIAEDKVVVEELRRKNRFFCIHLSIMRNKCSRLAKIEENWKRHDEELAKYYDEKASAGDRQMEEEQELQRKVREVQEFFGYWVDPKVSIKQRKGRTRNRLLNWNKIELIHFRIHDLI
jgi:hypothetical protein